MQPKILIIEDETDINQLLAKILEADGCRAVQAFSGTEGLLLAEKESPDLILLDLMLPGLSGETLLQKLRTEKNCRVPVLVLSAKAALSDKVTLLKAGADDYITKPFEPEEVSARVQAALRRSGSVPEQAGTLSYKDMVLYPESRSATPVHRGSPGNIPFPGPGGRDAGAHIHGKSGRVPCLFP